MEFLVAIAGMLVLILILKILQVSAKMISKVFINSISGIIGIFVFNLIASFFGYNINLNFLNSLIVGVFGLAGIIFIILFNI